MHRSAKGHSRIGRREYQLDPSPFWSDLNFLFEGPPTNKEVIGRTIQMLAEGIPRLQQLRLGDQDIPRTEDGRPAYNAPSKKPQNDGWCTYRHWEKVVEER